MDDFLTAVLDYPTVLFSFLLVVVVGYWILVLTGVLDLGTGSGADTVTGADGGSGTDTGSGSDGGRGSGGFLTGLGLNGPPLMVVVSLLVGVAWFTSLAGAVLLRRYPSTGVVPALLSTALLLLALLVAWRFTRLLVRPLRVLFEETELPSRTDFVGRVCVIRTGRVTADFGQAEVTAADGSSAIVQVRQAGGVPLGAGDRALVYGYDAEREFFWVLPIDAALDPDLFRPGSKDV